MKKVKLHVRPAALGLLACAALLSGTALANEPADSAEGVAVASANAGAKKPEPMVCRKLTVSGSRMPKRVCATKLDWEDLSKRAAQGLEDHQQESDRRSLLIPDSR